MNETLTLSSLFEGLAGHGRQPAVVKADGGDSPVLTYRQLADRVEAVAVGASAYGYDRVALFAAPDADWISVFLGLLRAGITAVPIDTQMEREQLSVIFAETDIPCVIADEARASILEEIDYDGTVPRLDHGGGARSWQRWLDIDGEVPDLPAADGTALLLFTSGTTGPPKGVPLTHRNLAFQARAVRETGLVAAEDRMLQPLPLHHVYPLVIGTLAPLSLGIPIVMPSSLTGPDIIRAIREHGVTIILGVPRLYAALLAGVDARLDGLPAPVRVILRILIRTCTALRSATGVNAGRVLLQPLHRQLGPSLRMLASGGSPLDPGTAHRLEGIGWNVAIGYGLTETSPLLTVRMPGHGHLDTVGQAIGGIELDIDRSVEAAGEAEHEDETGEILARGPGVFDGYLDREDETRESLTDDGWFRTGDLGWIDDDGYLHVIGRKSTMLVTASGENIRTEALEEAYAEHPLIAEIGILKDGEQLAAVIFPDLEALRRESRSAEDAIAAAVRERARALPSYQRIDRYRVTREPLDRTRLDKIRRNKLAERYESLVCGEEEAVGEPMDIEDMQAEDRELLRNERARKAWELLAERYRRTRLTPDTSFQLELGVDSLGWLDLSMDVARRTGAELREDDIAGIEIVRDMLATVAGKEESDEELHTPLEQPDAILTDEQKEWLEPRSRASAVTARAAYAVNTALMRTAFRVRAAGEPPPQSGPLLIAPNHASFLDPFVLAATLPPDARLNTFWGGWTGWAYRNAVFRGFSRLGRVIPIDPRRTVVSSLAFAKAALDRDRILVWFPEGERSRDGELQPLRPGIGALLEQASQITVLPVSIERAFDAWPRGQRLPRPARIVVRYGEEISVKDLHDRGAGDSDRERILDGLRGAILELQERN